MKENDNALNSSKLRLAVIQRVCPEYRTALFRSLSTDERLDTILILGENVPNSKVKSSDNLDMINFVKLKTWFIKIGHRSFGWNFGLTTKLREFDPDVILCEGESHFIGYVRAIIYRYFFNKRTALIHWCFTSLPGEPLHKSGLISKIKSYFRQHFDSFLLYSSFSKECLVELGISEHKAIVATNVGDVSKFLSKSDSLKMSSSEARSKLKLPERFTVLYAGTLDKNKNPEMMLNLARKCDPSKFNFVLIGSGELLEDLRAQVKDENLINVYLPGRVTEELFQYYRSSDSILIPGRGGVIISEAMSFGIPVIVHQADGTEYDLIDNNITGIRLQEGNLSDFRQAIEFLQSTPEKHSLMGKHSRDLVEQKYTTNNMVENIIKATYLAKNEREKKLKQ